MYLVCSIVIGVGDNPHGKYIAVTFFYHFPLKSSDPTIVGHRLGNTDLGIEQYIMLLYNQ